MKAPGRKEGVDGSMILEEEEKKLQLLGETFSLLPSLLLVD